MFVPRLCLKIVPEILDSCGFPFEQAFEFQIGFLFIEKNHFNIHVVSGGMEKVGEESRHRLVIDVATNNDKLTAIWFILSSIP